MSCHVFSRLLTSCHIISCHFMSRHDTPESCSRTLLPSLLHSSIMAAGWPPRGFRSRGPLRESGSERRSRCGAARIASVCVGAVRILDAFAWQAAGIVRAGRCVAGMSRGRRPGNRFAWQAAGIGRVGGCVAGMSRAVSAAPCRGDWVLGARMI